MKNIKTFEAFFSREEQHLKRWKSEKEQIDHMDLILDNIFEEVKERGYEFIKINKPTAYDPTRKSISSWKYELVNLDGHPPIFKDLLAGPIYFTIENPHNIKEDIVVKPSIVKQHSDGYNNSNLFNDFGDYYTLTGSNSEIVNEICNFIDNLEIKVLDKN